MTDPTRDHAHLILTHPSRRQRRRADSQSGSHEGRPTLPWDGVLVHRDARVFEGPLGVFSRQIFMARPQIDEDEMVVRTAADEMKPSIGEPLAQGLRVGDRLRRVVAEARLERLEQRDGLGCDHVHEGSALHEGEDRLVDPFGVLLRAEDEPSSRSPERLVGRRSHDVGVRYRRRVMPGGDEPRDVRHVDDEAGTDLSGDLAESLEIDHAGIRARPGNEHLGALRACLIAERVVVDASVVFAHAVRDDFEEPAAEVHG